MVSVTMQIEVQGESYDNSPKEVNYWMVMTSSSKVSSSYIHFLPHYVVCKPEVMGSISCILRIKVGVVYVV